MSLKYKTLLFVTLCIAAMLVGTGYASRYLVLGQFDRLEHERTRSGLRVGRNIVMTMTREFEQHAQDWSDWDDLAEHVKDGNQAFRDANVNVPSLEVVDWDILVILTEEGLRQTSVMLDRKQKILVRVPQPIETLIDDGLLKPTARATSGLHFVDGHFWMLAARRVYRSDRSAAPKPGWMVVGRVIDSAWVERFHRYTSLQTEFLPVNVLASDAEVIKARESLAQEKADYVVKRPSGTLVGYSRITDLRGNPAVDMRITRAPELSTAATQTLDSLRKMIVVSGVLLAFLAFVLINRGVLRPLAALSEGVRRLRVGERTTVAVHGHDEIAQLARAFNEMASTLVDREESLKLVLDNVGDGLVITTLSGCIVGEVSAPGLRWFGEPKPKTTLWEWLAVDVALSGWFERGYEQIDEGYLPFRLLADQLPQRFSRDGNTYELDFRQVLDESEQQLAVLVIIHDITVQLEQERAEEQARELQLAVANLLHDRKGFVRFIKECDRLVESVCTANEPIKRQRALHTLKGSASACGILRVARLCHELEDELAEDPGGFGREKVDRLRGAWDEAQSHISGYMTNEDNVVELSLAEYERFLAELEAKRDHRRLICRVKTWRHEPAAKVLGRLAAVGLRLAVKQSKQVEVTVSDGDLRVNVDSMSPFFTSLVHVVRNAIDHGIEVPEDRILAGKSPTATLSLQTCLREGMLVLSVKDDGRGIHWGKLREKATLLGLPAANQDDLIRAMFTWGVSTKEEVSEISGRGVGLEATYRAMEALGGVCKVTTESGSGSTFEFLFPLPDSEWAELV